MQAQESPQDDKIDGINSVYQWVIFNNPTNSAELGTKYAPMPMDHVKAIVRRSEYLHRLYGKDSKVILIYEIFDPSLLSEEQQQKIHEFFNKIHKEFPNVLCVDFSKVKLPEESAKYVQYLYKKIKQEIIPIQLNKKPQNYDYELAQEKELKNLKAIFVDTQRYLFLYQMKEVYKKIENKYGTKAINALLPYIYTDINVSMLGKLTKDHVTNEKIIARYSAGGILDIENDFIVCNLQSCKQFKQTLNCIVDNKVYGLFRHCNNYDYALYHLANNPHTWTTFENVICDIFSYNSVGRESMGQNLLKRSLISNLEKTLIEIKSNPLKLDDDHENKKNINDAINKLHSRPYFVNVGYVEDIGCLLKMCDQLYSTHYSTCIENPTAQQQMPSTQKQ